MDNPQIISTKKELVICPYCDGCSQTVRFEQRGPQQKRIEQTCTECKGHGRMWQVRTIGIMPISSTEKLYKQL